MIKRLRLEVGCYTVNIEPGRYGQRLLVELHDVDPDDLDVENLIEILGAEAFLGVIGSEACKRHFGLMDADK